MIPLVSSDVSKARIAEWINEAKPVESNPTWIEHRMAIVFGGHTYLIEKQQIFQCAHCGHYDPTYKSREVLRFFEENFGIKPTEIAITCSVAEVE